MLVRDINNRLSSQFPTDGPATLNGLILETIEEIPKVKSTVTISECRIDILETTETTVEKIKLYPPEPPPTEE